MSDRSAETELHKGRVHEDGHHCEIVGCWCWEERYQVITRSSTKELVEAVNAFIHQKGWKPLGGIVARVDYCPIRERSETLWAQAMARHV